MEAVRPAVGSFAHVPLAVQRERIEPLPSCSRVSDASVEERTVVVVATPPPAECIDAQMSRLRRSAVGDASSVAGLTNLPRFSLR